MYQQKFEAFAPDQLLLPGSISLAQALVCEQLFVVVKAAPTAEQSGAALLASTEFRELKNVHLQAERVRFLDVPGDADAMARRINWMWHAGSCSTDSERASRAAEAIDVMIAQVASGGQFDAETLTEQLSLLAHDHPDAVDALFRGDLDDAIELIDQSMPDGADEPELIEATAWMFVTWSALEQQREASLGWRLIHEQLDGVWGSALRTRWSIGQIFRPKSEQLAFAHEMAQLYHDNLDRNVETLEDKRTISRIERTLRKMSLGGFNRGSEAEIIGMFGKGRIGRISEILRNWGGIADACERQYRTLLTGPDGQSRGRPARRHARSTNLERPSYCHSLRPYLPPRCVGYESADNSRLARHARCRPSGSAATGAQQAARPDKLRLRQLFHVVRIEFLRDGEHLPKRLEDVAGAEHMDRPLELDEPNNRRGHELFDQCWAELNNQPADWRFIKPFGWQCDGLPRVQLTAGI